jgi:hypothetical protein
MHVKRPDPGRARLLDRVRDAAKAVAERARHVTINRHELEEYALALPLAPEPPQPDPEAHILEGSREERIAFALTLDAINFGSGWWPTIRKRPGLSGYMTMASGLADRFRAEGPWDPEELAEIDAATIAAVLDQNPEHELMGLYARALRELGARASEAGGYVAIVDRAGSSAEALVEELAGWPSFADVSTYDGLEVPLFKRAQVAASDLALAGVADFTDLDRLTLFADNLVPHVLRIDGVLRFDPALVERIEAEELIEHGSPEEVEIRACALHAVELIVAARGDTTARTVDHFLWNRGQQPQYKAHHRHRSRTTAY